MSHVHPVFDPILEEIGNRHFAAAVDRVFGILDTPRPVQGRGFKAGCVDCGASLGYDDRRCDRHAEEIQAERLENGRWDDRVLDACGDYDEDAL